MAIEREDVCDTVGSVQLSVSYEQVDVVDAIGVVDAAVAEVDFTSRSNTASAQSPTADYYYLTKNHTASHSSAASWKEVQRLATDVILSRQAASFVVERLAASTTAVQEVATASSVANVLVLASNASASAQTLLSPVTETHVADRAASRQRITTGREVYAQDGAEAYENTWSFNQTDSANSTAVAEWASTVTQVDAFSYTAAFDSTIYLSESPVFLACDAFAAAESVTNRVTAFSQAANRISSYQELYEAGGGGFIVTPKTWAHATHTLPEVGWAWYHSFREGDAGYEFDAGANYMESSLRLPRISDDYGNLLHLESMWLREGATRDTSVWDGERTRPLKARRGAGRATFGKGSYRAFWELTINGASRVEKTTVVYGRSRRRI